MLFTRALVAAAMAGVAMAQGQLAFTSTFTSVTAGQAVPITWTGGDGTSPVTITLRQGPSGSLSQGTVLTSAGSGGSYTWTPSSSLASGTDYALQITQGSATNYWGPFSLAGGGPASASASISSAASSSSSVVSSIVSSVSASLNSTIANATSFTAATATGTGSPTTANTTFSSATLSKTATLTATTDSGSGTGAPAPSKSSGASPNGVVSSPLALVLTAIVAMIYLQ